MATGKYEKQLDKMKQQIHVDNFNRRVVQRFVKTY